MSSRTRQLAEIDGEGVVWGGAGFAASLIVGVALSPFRSSLGLENVVIVYLAVVAVAAAIGGRAAGLVSSLSAALSYNFFFTTPYYTLRIDSASQVITVILLWCWAWHLKGWTAVGAMSRKQCGCVLPAGWVGSRLARLADGDVNAW
jgi:K+-sensing histidine kinase KdpD